MTNEQIPKETPYGQYAGFATRLVGWLIDQVIVIAITTVITAVGAFVIQSFSSNAWLGIGDISSLVVVILTIVVTVATVLLYYLGFWLLAGQTPGKRIMGVRIVRTNGERLRFRDAVVRYVGYWVSAILFLGYLWVLVDDRRQGFHDKLARTIVIYTWPEPEDWQAPMRIRDRVRRSRQRRGTA